ncbi:MAG TPA: SHOCT domain-containing protein [Nitrospiria bacterium]|nr:SHOCT domain-containing protein [Nitrospiria bacterium]
MKSGKRIKNGRSSLKIPVLLGVATAPAAEEGYMPWMGHPMWGAWGFGMMFVMLIFWGLVIVGLVFAIRWFAAQTPRVGPPQHGEGESALEILKKRYARGEIDKEEFETKKRDLL